MTRRSVLGAAGASAAVGLAAGSASAAGRRPAEVIAARRKFFGAANVSATGAVRRDRVILSWFGVTNFAMAIGGRVVLLDAWVPRGPYSGVVPTSPEELGALRPSHIFIGHGHFDHAADAAAIAVASDAIVVGTATHCAQIAGQATQRVRTRALPIAAEGDRANLTLGRRIRVNVIAHPHSAVKAPTGEHPPLFPVPDLTPILTHPPTLEDLLGFVGHQSDQEGASLLYRFRIGDFSLVWNDSCGPVRDSPKVLKRLKGLRRPTVQVGAVQGFGQYTNGLRDPLDYIRAIRPHLFVPSHHDNWAPPLSSPAAGYERPLRDGLAGIPAAVRPKLRFMTDPVDYIRPKRLTFKL